MRHWIITLVRWFVQIAPAVLVATSGYLLFIVIVPFFLLGIHAGSGEELFCGKIWLGTALGRLAAYVAILIEISFGLISYVWALSAVNFIITRRWYVLVILVLAPLPFAFFNAGPYHQRLAEWVWPF